MTTPFQHSTRKKATFKMLSINCQESVEPGDIETNIKISFSTITNIFFSFKNVAPYSNHKPY